ncbi:Polyadenylate-binding protein 1A [Acropora cervicornis]|uniref:Polyadenylate-binding protein 1A n=1 Tax=Acropora cervicornis TaxID=6130 RepID=A0AAD9V3I1_ACRCE|nr:Polyadenylate-binding protein 1A [Acropora cervicornis]
MCSHGNSSRQGSGLGKIFIKNLDKSIDNTALYDSLSAFGNILSYEIALTEDGTSKGFGFVDFDSKEAAEDAIAKGNGMLLNGKKVVVEKWRPAKERLDRQDNQPKKFTNVYIKNFGEDMDEERLRQLAEKFGKVLSLKVMTDESGCPKGFGFVCYETPEQAQKAVDELCGREWNGQKLYAGRFQRKAERQMDLKSHFEKKKSERIIRYQGVNLFVKNLDDTIDDGRLREEFSECGTITSTKVMMDDKDNSKEEANKAATEMNGRILVTKPLYVALAQTKEERRAQLATEHMQHLRKQQAAGQPVGQVFPQGGAFYMQLLAQAGQRPIFTPQMQPVRPGWQPMQPQQQGETPQVPGGPRGMQAQRQPFKFGQNARNQPQGHSGIVAMQSQDPVQQSIHTPGQEPLNSRELAAASPQEQKQIIGERLYPLIQSTHPDQAGKITGMLLEIDNAELLHILESCDALAAKIQEVVSVLRAHSAKEKSEEIKN